jgi:nuclear factor related to kappa-B-binding protein
VVQICKTLGHLLQKFTLITPTGHTGFSFSIIHLLSAVRLAMITPLPEDLEVSKPREEHNKNQEGSVNRVPSHEKVDVNVSEHAGQGNGPSLTVQEIVNRVKSNPGDPCILETQEPLQDLVRGVLKIFSSKTAPLGAKGWKVLATYEKSTKSWSWIGPVSHSLSDHETIEEVTSSEAWGLPHKMLVKLVDSFANWLKSGQETLQQIGSLPAPPLALMQFNLDEKERFRDLRAQKSLNTISPSSEEVRSYFRKEEVLRYSIPDRAFSYTAADGRKSIVAPLRRCGGKPTSKARDHFMLKRDRPPHVTILCLVRDAAARLPGSIGTRADVCTLIRDSQYIVEDVSDAQVNQVVSGALDRLHYERDPCVQFDGERKLWVYLHREREEEDFEDDGTSSTKKWKRQKKDPAEQSDQGAVTVAYHGSGDQTGYDLCSDLNVEPSCNDDDKVMEPVYNDVRQNLEENVDMNHGSEHSDTHQDHPVVWEDMGLNPMRENKLLCQENSRNEDFDDETFGRERPVGLLSASLL